MDFIRSIIAPCAADCYPMRQMSNVYPMRLEPVYQSYLWGGDRIPRLYGRTVSVRPCAESWEVSDRPEGQSRIVNGPFSGLGLGDVVQRMGAVLLGRRANGTRFPLLIKLIDARETLSLQVHPDDARAAVDGSEAKTEMWYALHTDPEAFIYDGLLEGTGADAFLTALAKGSLESVLRRRTVAFGQQFYVPGGRVHAIGAGCLFLEVQQNSNTTYRIHDWGRLGADGKPRVLHVEEAMRAIHWNPAPDTRPEESPYFQLIELNIAFEQRFRPAGESFHVLFVAEGEVRIDGLPVPRGGTVLIPADLPEYTIYPINGPVKVLRIQLPPRAAKR